MQGKYRSAAPFLVALTALLACGEAIAQRVIETTMQSMAERRIGSEYRDEINDIYASLSSEGADVSQRRLAPIIAYCEAQERPGRRLVSVATTAEYEAFLAEHADGLPTEWIDMACPMAYDLKGYIFSGMGKFADAMPWLDRAIALAPYYGLARNERAYVLAHSGHLQEGLAAYRETVAIANSHADAAQIKPIALRGIGWILIEQGDLDGAEAVYRESLQLDPNNATATSELDYIRGLRKKAQAGSSEPR